MTVWRGRRVFLTGHTGFKGAWLGLWLEALGADVCGYALKPLPGSLYAAAGLGGRWREDIADIRDFGRLRSALLAARPSVVLHLAAQSLVLASHSDPVGTYATNVMGTVHLLEAVRSCPSVEAVVVVTTDKVYQNVAQIRSHREEDPLGGDDPYSSSKACIEHVTAAYRASFLSGTGAPLVATARAGNVIGGGDRSANRLLPDLVDAFAARRPVRIRYPNAIRPWQFVLEPLQGYLLLAEALLAGRRECAAAWNFAPPPTGLGTVMNVVRLAAEAWGDGAAWEIDTGEHIPETAVLGLDATRAVAQLGWQPQRDLRQAVGDTIAWYRAVAGGADAMAITQAQIGAYGRPGEDG